MKKVNTMAVAVALFAVLVFSASAQMMNQGQMNQGGAGSAAQQRNAPAQAGSGGHQGGMGMMDMMGMMDGGMMGGMMGGMQAQGPDSAYLLRHRQALGLSAEQVERIRNLNLELIRTESRAQAEIRIATAELDVMLAARTPAMPQVEQKVRDIQTQRGNLMIANIRYLQQAKAVLTPDQLQKFESLNSTGMMGGGMMGGFGQPGPGAAQQH